jgi:Domain of unknown function (DUF305)
MRYVLGLVVAIVAGLGGIASAQTGSGSGEGSGQARGSGSGSGSGSSHGSGSGQGSASGQSQGSAANTAVAPSTKAFEEANAKMHAGMSIAFTGDADIDFVRGMIAHHQGAVDMAEILLKFGKDDEMRKLAQSIIADQQREIAQMQGWLKAKNLK